MLPDPVAVAVDRAHREEWGQVVAATARVAGDLGLAEDCAQDAFAQAMVRWPADGVPERPGAWLTTVATRRALQQLRRAAVLRRKLPLLVVDDAPAAEPDAFPDDLLRLVFTCCHPALAQDSQVALTLRLVCGLTSAEIAKAFLVKEATMQARLTRAKRKIAEARIPFRVPGPADLPERIGAVLDVVHLVYTAGHTALSGDSLTRPDTAARGLDLARMMARLLPGEPEVEGLLALLVLTQARDPARTDEHGNLILLADQDRGRWDRAAVADGLRLVESALSAGPAGRFALMAALAAVHAAAPTWADTDWEQMLGLYDLLLARWPSPVVALNRVVALAHARGEAEALADLEHLGADPTLATYPYLAATRAELLRRTGDRTAAIAAYGEALLLTGNGVEAEYLRCRLDSLAGS